MISLIKTSKALVNITQIYYLGTIKMTSVIVRINLRVRVGEGELSKRVPLFCFFFLFCLNIALEAVEGNNRVFNFNWDKTNEHQLNL